VQNINTEFVITLGYTKEKNLTMFIVLKCALFAIFRSTLLKSGIWAAATVSTVTWIKPNSSSAKFGLDMLHGSPRSSVTFDKFGIYTSQLNQEITFPAN
jgi:hypothetical protein